MIRRSSSLHLDLFAPSLNSGRQVALNNIGDCIVGNDLLDSFWPVFRSFGQSFERVATDISVLTE